MYEIKCDVAIIGAGPAGLAAAYSAKKEGANKVLLIERDSSMGGILQQCIHPGFGLTYFKEELTGPEYAGRFIEDIKDTDIEKLLDTMVLEIDHENGKVICANSKLGLTCVNTKSIVLAMGCRERTRANIQIPGSRPSGIYTAGAGQRLINRQNLMIGKKVIILGSGDIGMIMARRLSLEGAKVISVIEINSFLAGLTRNKVQCLDDFGIPLKLSHTITGIVGETRIEGVYVAKVDENMKPIEETEEYFECDTLLLSVGLMPENELTRKAEIEISKITNGPTVNQYMQTTAKNVYACGNVVHVNDLVDNVTTESMQAGKYAALYAMGKLDDLKQVNTIPGENVRYICPQRIATDGEGKAKAFFRVLKPQLNVEIQATCGDKLIASKKAQRVNPGEMCNIEIPVAEAKADIRIDVKEAK